MKKLGETRPFIAEVIIFLIGMVIALAVASLFSTLAYSNEVNIALGRIIAGLILFIVFRRSVTGGKPFSGMKFFPIAFLFAVWNIVYNLKGGAAFGKSGVLLPFILALAPAIFEEVIFRGIFIPNLKAKGYDNVTALIMSSAFFGGVHATNLVGADLKTTALQIFYATVIGMVLGAIYLCTRDILSLILIHFSIDFASKLFSDGPTKSSVPELVIFIALMLLECAYVVWIMKKIDRDHFTEKIEQFDE